MAGKYCANTVSSCCLDDGKLTASSSCSAKTCTKDSDCSGGAACEALSECGGGAGTVILVIVIVLIIIAGIGALIYVNRLRIIEFLGTERPADDGADTESREAMPLRKRTKKYMQKKTSEWKARKAAKEGDTKHDAKGKPPARRRKSWETPGPKITKDAMSALSESRATIGTAVTGATAATGATGATGARLQHAGSAPAAVGRPRVAGAAEKRARQRFNAKFGPGPGAGAGAGGKGGKGQAKGQGKSIKKDKDKLSKSGFSALTQSRATGGTTGSERSGTGKRRPGGKGFKGKKLDAIAEKK